MKIKWVRMVKVIFFAVIISMPGVAMAEADFLKGFMLGNWRTDIGAEERLRYEFKSDFDFNAGRKDNGSLIYNRVRLNAKAKLADKCELFVEGMDLRVGNHHLKKTNQQDDFDLHQAYFMARNISGLNLDAKIGRQELAYGKGRLVWAATWSNRINHFDAAVLRYKHNGLYVDLFSGAKVGYDTNRFNRTNAHELFSGLYSGYQKSKNSPVIEGYFLSQADAEDPENLRRYTVGGRFQTSIWRDLVIEFEIPYQFGNDQSRDISAYALHFDVSREFSPGWKPKINLIYNLASGDKNPQDNKAGTFVPVYQSTHDPYGVMDLFRWQNMHEAALELALSPSKKLKIIPATNFFWLYSNKDSWYDSSGTRLRTDTTGSAGHYAGQELSLRSQFSLNDYIKIEGGYAHFFTGGYVNDTGADDDADWLYFQFNVKI